MDLDRVRLLLGLLTWLMIYRLWVRGKNGDMPFGNNIESWTWTPWTSLIRPHQSCSYGLLVFFFKRYVSAPFHSYHIRGRELLHIQGIQYDDSVLKVCTENQLADLAGNSFLACAALWVRPACTGWDLPGMPCICVWYSMFSVFTFSLMFFKVFRHHHYPPRSSLK